VKTLKVQKQEQISKFDKIQKQNQQLRVEHDEALQQLRSTTEKNLQKLWKF